MKFYTSNQRYKNFSAIALFPLGSDDSKQSFSGSKATYYWSLLPIVT